MNNPRKGPGAGTRAYIALEVLHQLGGNLRDATWENATMQKLAAATRVKTWAANVQYLLNAGLVLQRADAFSITDDGLTWLGIPVDAPRREAAVIVGPRYVAPIRPLSDKYKQGMRVMREGALDYRDIPSRMGDTLIPHGAKA